MICFKLIKEAVTSVAYRLACQTCSAANWDRLPRGEVMDLLFNFFEGSNEE